MRKGVKKWNKNSSYFFSLIKVKERKITLYKHLHYNHIPYHLLTHYIWYQLSAPGVPGSILDLGSRNIRGIFFCIILGTLYMEDRNRSHFWETSDKKYHHNWCENRRYRRIYGFLGRTEIGHIFEKPLTKNTTITGADCDKKKSWLNYIYIKFYK